MQSLDNKKNNDKDNKNDKESIKEQSEILDLKYTDLLNNRIIINLRVKIFQKTQTKNDNGDNDPRNNKQRNNVCGGYW